MILSSIPAYLLLPSIVLVFANNAIGKAFLWFYLVIYISVDPGGNFLKKREFSNGVPGGNEWRESLRRLGEPEFEAPPLLFQSPFIESNELNYEGKSVLYQYLSAPMQSFYVKQPSRPFVLLPVHWWINNETHQKFKANLARQLVTQREFILLSTQEFWENFGPWLLRQKEGKVEIRVEEEFRSSGSLRIRKIGIREIHQ